MTIEPLNASLTKRGLQGSIDNSRVTNGAAIEVAITAIELTSADLGQPDQGLMDVGETDLAIVTSRMVMRAGGIVNLIDETLHIDFVPIQRFTCQV